MKIIHCADIHLDSPLTANLDESQISNRQYEMLDTFSDMLVYAEKNKCEAVLIAGDIFDSSNVSRETYNAVVDLIERFKSIKFYYVQGNHDISAFLYDDIKRLENLEVFGISSTVILKRCINHNITITGLNQNPSGFSYDEINLNENDYNIVMLHGMVSEYSKNTPDNICLDKLRNKNIDYLALGHIHSYRFDILDKRGNYCYSGCLEPRGFDECGEHGFVMLEIEENTLAVKHRFVPFSKRNCYEIDVDVNGCKSAYAVEERIDEALTRGEHKSKNLILINLFGNLEFDLEPDIPYFYKQFGNDYYTFRIHNNTKFFSEVDKSEYGTDITIKGEFLRLIKEQYIDEKDQDIMLDFAMKALAGEQINI